MNMRLVLKYIEIVKHKKKIIPCVYSNHQD